MPVFAGLSPKLSIQYATIINGALAARLKKSNRQICRLAPRPLRVPNGPVLHFALGFLEPKTDVLSVRFDAATGAMVPRAFGFADGVLIN
jgi:hypothetical protein